MRKFTAGILMSIILISAIAADCSGGSDKLKLFAVKYGTSEFPGKFIFYGDKSDKKLPFTWLFYYIEYGDRRILIDTGFNNETLRNMFEIRDFQDPVEILKKNGIKPESITDIIITHSHFDHIGNADKFINAKIFINKKELESFMKGNSLDHVRKYLKDNPNIQTFENSITVFDIFNIHTVGGHTSGSSVIFFNYMNKQYCITGDEIYLKENIISETGSGSVSNHDRNISFIKEIKKSGIEPLTLHSSIYYNADSGMIQIIPEKK